MSISGDDVTIEEGVEVDPSARIHAREIRLGYGTKIGARCIIGPCERFVTGDHCMIGHDSKLLAAGGYDIGDYVTLHNHLFSNGGARCRIGHNVWIGQNCILNVDADLTIGNGVGIGTYSSVWTHARHGEALEGCLISKSAPVTLEDDVWIVGCYTSISPGVLLGERAVVLPGSVVTHDVVKGDVVAGCPAKKMDMKFYEELTSEEKWERLKAFAKEFGGPVTIDVLNQQLHMGDGEKRTTFDLTTKTYNKQRTPLEVEFMRFLLYAKARFVPR